MQTLRSESSESFLRAVRVAAILLLCFGVASPIVAQTTRVRTPDKGVIGYGVDVGVLLPDETFENTLTLAGFGEYYVTPRVSIRSLVAFANPAVAGRDEDHFRQVKLLFSGIYNWEKGPWRPFGTFGAGVYFTQLHLDGTTDPPGEKRGGINFGGGAEYILNSESGIKTELRWEIVSHPFGMPDATGATLTVGYKRYF
jgi:hypothetical protein